MVQATPILIGSFTTFPRRWRCSKGHEWQESPTGGEIFWTGPKGERICGTCIQELLVLHCGTVEQVAEADTPIVREHDDRT